jgi:phosphohistidine phosphatase
MDESAPTAMKTLLLLRHAKSSWDDQGLDDVDRPLNARGQRDAHAIAPFVAAWHPQWIGCSAAKRTRQTLMPILDELTTSTQIAIAPDLYESNEAAYLKHLRALPASVDRALIIGHNPVLEGLTRLLTGSAEPGILERIADKLPTGTLVVLQCPIGNWAALAPQCATLRDAIRPRDLVDAG